MTPRRVQRRRAKGSLTAGAVYVGRQVARGRGRRTDKWGNPWQVEKRPDGWFVAVDTRTASRYTPPPPAPLHGPHPTRAAAAQHAVDEHARWLAARVAAGLDLTELAGKDLSCYCPPGQPCHGDTLLAAANPSTGRTGPVISRRRRNPCALAHTGGWRPPPPTDKEATA